MVANVDNLVLIVLPLSSTFDLLTLFLAGASNALTRAIIFDIELDATEFDGVTTVKFIVLNLGNFGLANLRI